MMRSNNIVLAILSLCMMVCNAQRQLLVGGNMDAKTPWTVYDLNSTTPATVVFNYQGAKPKLGQGACLRITASQASNALVWQKVTLKGGETYTVDGAIKTNNVASFWAEISLSLIPPVDSLDYLPSNNTDVVLGFSTWYNCGSSVDGTFGANSCTGKKSFVAPGNIGANITAYYCFKVGSMASPLPNNMEVLVDELQLLTRDLGVGNELLGVSIGTLQNGMVTIPNNISAAQLRSSISVSPYASFKIVNGNNTEVAGTDLVDANMKIVVTSEAGTAKSYTMAIAGQAQPTETFHNYKNTFSSLSNKYYTVSGSSLITINDAQNPLRGSMLNLLPDDAWIYFPNIKPSVFQNLYLAQVLIGGQAAVIDQNMRLVQYGEGCIVVSQSNAYQALQLFNADNLGGASMKFNINNYYRATQLGSFDNTAKSFVLKKGYMATLAQNESGTGISKVYVAYNEDLVVNKLPSGLYNDVSFVRVLPWRWTTKKGWTNGLDAANALRCTWNYDWDNVATSTLDVEYVPMRHNANWNAYTNINNKTNSTHALGFNEPDRTDQANMTVAAALSAWPEMLKSGLRLGSPVPSDASAGLTWLYQFIDKCDSLNYRVDFVTVHWYKGGQTAKQFYDWLKAVNVRTKRPIWITEWNNGANWTCCEPSYDQQSKTIGEMINMLDTASFVERYSLYEWVGDTRKMFYQSPLVLTPAGISYKDNTSPLAYNPKKSNVVVTEIEASAGISESDGTFLLYPNPCSETLYLETDGKPMDVTLLNVDGSILKKLSVTPTGHLDVKDVKAGVYLIKGADGQNVWIRKLVKE